MTTELNLSKRVVTLVHPQDYGTICKMVQSYPLAEYTPEQMKKLARDNPDKHEAIIEHLSWFEGLGFVERSFRAKRLTPDDFQRLKEIWDLTMQSGAI